MRSRWFTFIALAVAATISLREKDDAMSIGTMPQMQHSSDTPERRRHLRVTPSPFLVIRFASGNAGVVLDVSHEGLGFLASAPVNETQFVRFEIAGRSKLTSEAIGRLMWKDSTGKRAGLKFTQIPRELRTLIESFLPAEETVRAEASGPVAALVQNLNLEEHVRALPRNPKLMVFAANAVTCALACFIVLGIWRTVGGRSPAGAAGAPSHAQQRITGLFSFLRAPLSSVDAAKPVPSAPQPPAEALTPASPGGSDGGVSLAELTRARLPLPAAPLATIELFELSPARAGLRNSASAAAGAAASAVAKDAAASPAGKHPAVANAGTPGDASQAPLDLARGLLKKDAGPEEQAKAAQLLWHAVEKGNVAAELALADLYLAGQGVEKSCSQARVLLTTAQNHKSSLAAKKLNGLAAYGCE